jgi:hypothetical protein
MRVRQQSNALPGMRDLSLQPKGGVYAERRRGRREIE